MRKARKKWLFALLLVGVMMLFLPHSLVEAAEVSYTVQTKLPENQRNTDKTYFDLRMKPGQQQTVEMILTNKAEKEVTVDLHIADGMTNINGVIDYKKPDEVLFDETLKTPMTSIAKIVSSVTIPAKGEITVPIELHMPEVEFNGMIIGAVVLRQVEEDDPEKGEKKGMGVHNVFQHQVGIVLTENDNPIQPDMLLLGVKAAQVNYRNVVEATLRNPEPTVMEELKLEAKIYPRGSTTVVYEETKEQLRMAPNSRMDYPIWLGKKPFKAGNYTLKLVATAGEQKWEFSEDFVITRKEADEFNKESAVELDQEVNWLLYIGIGLGVIVVLGVIGFMIARHQIKKAQQQRPVRKKTMDRDVSKKSRPTKQGSKEKDQKPTNRPKKNR